MSRNQLIQEANEAISYLKKKLKSCAPDEVDDIENLIAFWERELDRMTPNGI